MHRILIIGGGYAGLAALIALRERWQEAEIVLVDPSSYHVHRTRLHERIRHRETRSHLILPSFQGQGYFVSMGPAYGAGWLGRPESHWTAFFVLYVVGRISLQDKRHFQECYCGRSPHLASEELETYAAELRPDGKETKLLFKSPWLVGICRT